jgi:hypothetical protein
VSSARAQQRVVPLPYERPHANLIVHRVRVHAEHHRGVLERCFVAVGRDVKHRSELSHLRDDDKDSIRVLGDAHFGVRAVVDVRALTGARWEHGCGRVARQSEVKMKDFDCLRVRDGMKTLEMFTKQQIYKGDTAAATHAVTMPETKLTALLLRNSKPLMRVTVGPGLLTTRSRSEQYPEY